MRWVLAILVACGCGATKASRLTDAASARLAAGDDEGALALARKGLALAPDDPWLRYDEGCALAHMGRTDEALVALAAAERGFEDDYDKARAVFRAGVALEGAGRCAEAVREYRRYGLLVLGSDPRAAAASADRIRACKTTAPAPFAPAPARVARAPVKVARDDPWRLYARGVALVERGRIDEGAAVLRKAEKGFATPAEQALPAFRRALAYEQAGRCVEAVRELRHYERLSGDSATVERHLESCPGSTSVQAKR